MPAPASKTAKVIPIDSRAQDVDAEELLDRTMELDIRGLLYEEENNTTSRGRTTLDDPTVVLDMTEAQVDDLLSRKK